jgi:hypothetical protein
MVTMPGDDNRNIIDRVLKLIRCMGIDNELSAADPKSGVLERPLSGLGGHDRRRLYAFTKDPDGPHVKQQKFIIQPASLCNINCSYCYLPVSPRQWLCGSTRACLMRLPPSHSDPNGADRTFHTRFPS